MKSVALCTVYKNEARYLAEWIEYHLMIGIEHFYLYNDNSTDNHLEILKPYIDNKIVTYDVHHGVFHNGDASIKNGLMSNSYDRCTKKYKNDVKWIGFIDMDEYIVIRGSMSISDFLIPYESYGALSINWLCFGSSYNYLEPEGLVIENYYLRPSHKHSVNFLTKCIVNPRKFIDWRGQTHMPDVIDSVVDENFQIRNTADAGHFSNKISLFHYFRKSKEFFIFNKMARVLDINMLKTEKLGDHLKNTNISPFAGRYYSNTSLWEDTNSIYYNCVEDRSLFKYIPLLKKKLNMATKTKVNFLDNLMIDWKEYSNRDDVRKYIETNIKLFKNQSISAAVHYWFIFDNRDRTKVNIKTISELVKDIDLKKYEPSQMAKYNLYFLDTSCETMNVNDFTYACYLSDDKITENFDWKFYTSFYQDLSKFDNFAAMIHWKHHGQYEGRIWNTEQLYEKFYKIFPGEKFDWQYYVSANKDLSHFDEIHALDHFLNYGQYEGRIFNIEKLYEKFDWKYYVSVNKDLSHFDEIRARDHFLNYGRHENREFFLK